MTESIKPETAGSQRDELQRMALLDTPPEERFDRIIRLARLIFDVPTALLSFIDNERQWFKARAGFDWCETSRHDSFCRYTLAESGVFVVEDAREHPIFKSNPLVIGEPGIRFYAGRAIRGAAGKPIGALCVVDRRSRSFNHRQQQLLTEMAAMVEAEVAATPLPEHSGEAGHVSDEMLIHADIERVITQAAHTGQTAAVFYLKVDNLTEFKLLHDDKRLASLIARWLVRLKRRHPSLHYLARLSESVFVGVLRAGEDIEQLRRRCDALWAEALRHPRFAQDRFIFNASAGVSLFPDHAVSASELLNAARLAHANCHPGETTHFFSPGLVVRSQRQSRLQSRLEPALTDRAIGFHWQPIFASVGRRLAAFELLARWHDTRLGRIPPDEFIPLIDRQAELRRALVVEALETACGQLRRWRADGFECPRVAVNIPGGEFYREDFADLVHNIRSRYRIHGKHLILELTEQSLIPDFAATAQTMQRLRLSGVQIAIDDFGSGYSSIAYLTELPISLLKIDKRVVQQIDRSAQRYRLMQSIVDLAHGQNLPTIAEGVETETQLALVSDMHCEYAQGYLLGRPQPATAALALLAPQIADR